MRYACIVGLKIFFWVYSLVFIALGACGCGESLQGEGPLEGVSTDSSISQALRIVREGLSDTDPQVRAQAVEVVVTAEQIELMPEVQRLLKDDIVPVRFISILAVGDLKYRPAESFVKRVIDDPDKNVRIAAAYSLAGLGYRQRLSIVRDAVKSDDQTVRANAVVLLGKSGDSSATELLYWAMKDRSSDDKVRFQAAEAIAKLGDENIYPKLWTLLISAYADDRIMGIRAMAALGTPKAKGAVVTMLGDKVLEVRLVAAEQLGMLGNVSGEPEVLDVFTKNLTAGLDAEATERVEVLTAMAISQIRTVQLRKYLPQLIESRSKIVRLAAAKAVLRGAR